MISSDQMISFSATLWFPNWTPLLNSGVNAANPKQETENHDLHTSAPASPAKPYRSIPQKTTTSTHKNSIKPRNFHCIQISFPEPVPFRFPTDHSSFSLVLAPDACDSAYSYWRECSFISNYFNHCPLCLFLMSRTLFDSTTRLRLVTLSHLTRFKCPFFVLVWVSCLHNRVVYLKNNLDVMALFVPRWRHHKLRSLLLFSVVWF